MSLAENAEMVTEESVRAVDRMADESVLARLATMFGGENGTVSTVILRQRRCGMLFVSFYARVAVFLQKWAMFIASPYDRGSWELRSLWSACTPSHSLFACREKGLPPSAPGEDYYA